MLDKENKRAREIYWREKNEFELRLQEGHIRKLIYFSLLLVP